MSKSVTAIGLWGNSIRYKNMSNDPSIQDGIKVFNMTKEIVESLSSLAKAKSNFAEAYEYNKKLLKQSVNLIKTNDISKIFEDKK